MAKKKAALGRLFVRWMLSGYAVISRSHSRY